MILVDSSVWIAYFNDAAMLEVEALHTYLDEEEVICGDLILTEVLQGFRSAKDFQEARSLLSSLDMFELGGYDIALQAAVNYRLLRASGVTIRKTIDMIIATWCISKNAVLLHADRDFEAMRSLGLRVWQAN